jgi:heme-degrading monooxygenase HmoA
MFARIVTMRLKPNAAADFNKTLEHEVVPLLRRRTGFRDEICLVAPNGNEAIGISLWDSKEHAEAYNRETYPAATRPKAGASAGDYDVFTHAAVSRRQRGEPLAPRQYSGAFFSNRVVDSGGRSLLQILRFVRRSRRGRSWDAQIVELLVSFVASSASSARSGWCGSVQIVAVIFQERASRVLLGEIEHPQAGGLSHRRSGGRSVWVTISLRSPLPGRLRTGMTIGSRSSLHA